MFYCLCINENNSSDAVMLSAESAAGRYPIESVTMQQQVINKVETDGVFRTSLDRFAEDFSEHLRGSITSAITVAARQVRCVYFVICMYGLCSDSLT